MRRHPLSRAALPLLLIGLAAPAAAATRIDLGGAWQFRIDADGSGGRRGWASAVPSPVETVDVPHTWGVGPHAEHEGLAWYWKRVDVPPALRGRRLELHFGATFYKARVFVNGALVGEHEGGHTAWFLDVTRALGNGRPRRGRDRQPARPRHDPGLGDEAEGHRDAVVRLVALRRHRARRGPRGAGARGHPPAGDPADGWRRARATVTTRVFLERFSARRSRSRWTPRFSTRSGAPWPDGPRPCPESPGAAP